MPAPCLRIEFVVKSLINFILQLVLLVGLFCIEKDVAVEIYRKGGAVEKWIKMSNEETI
jgi:hypothetical protein